jgi:hypothetical protein
MDQATAMRILADEPSHSITGFGDCKLQITVAFAGLNFDYYYPWRVWVRGRPVWVSQWDDHLNPNNLGFATATMWLRILRLLEALDPDLTAGQIVQSRSNPKSLEEVLGAYAQWEVEVITKPATGDGQLAAILKSDPVSGKPTSFQAQGTAQDSLPWTTERIGEFFPIDVGVWPG